MEDAQAVTTWKSGGYDFWIYASTHLPLTELASCLHRWEDEYNHYDNDVGQITSAL